MLGRRIRDLEKVSNVKVPIIYPQKVPAPPLLRDYEVLGVSPESNNRQIIKKFRQLSSETKEVLTVKHQERFLEYSQAYDKIMMYRMSQQGLPMPISHDYYPPETHTKMIRQFIAENAFWTPHVSPYYVRNLFIFWLIFGTLHTLADFYDIFEINKTQQISNS